MNRNYCLDFLDTIRQRENGFEFWDLVHNSHISFDSFYCKVIELVSSLTQKGITKKTCIYTLENSVESFILCFAIQVAHNSIVLIPPEDNIKINELAASLSAQYIFIPTNDSSDMSKKKSGDFFSYTVRNTTSDKSANSSSDQYVFFLTSGSTGEQKVVKHFISSTFLMAVRVSEFLSHYPLGRKTLLLLPTYHIYGYVDVLLSCMYMGIGIAVGRGLITINEDIKMVRPSCLFCVPALLNMFYNYSRTLEDNNVVNYLGGEIQTLLSGGGPLDPAFPRYITMLSREAV